MKSRDIAMNCRQFRGLLVRPSSLSLLPQNSCPGWLRTAPIRTAQRCLNTSPSARAARPQPRPDSEPEADMVSETRSLKSESNFPSNYGSQASSTETSQAIDDLFRSSGVGMSRRRAAQSPHRSSATTDPEAIRNVFGSQFSDPKKPNLRPRGLDWQNMSMPDSDPLEMPQTPAIREEDIVYPRLTPSYGRTVELDPSKGRDIVRGLGMLGSLMARNKVKSDFYKQRFHERPGLKRKRLKMERWRARFKVGFDSVTKRVTELTRKGW